MYSQILEKVKTKNDVRLLLDEIQVLKNSLYQETSLENALEEKVRYTVAGLIRKEMVNQKDKEKYLKGLERELSKLEVLTIYIAYEPSRSEINNIYAKMYEDLNNGFVLDVRLDPGIIAGATIEYKGNYRDYSLSKRIEDTMNNDSKRNINK